MLRSTLGRAVPVRGEGHEHVPKRGRALVVANHRCWIDPIFISFEVPRIIQWAGIDFHFKIPLVARVAKEAGIIPLPVEGGRKSRKALKLAARILRRNVNHLVGIFPEGTANFLNPSKEEKIVRFHTGFARIALEARVPILPVAIKGYGEEELARVPGALIRPFTPLEQFREGASLIIYREAVVNIGELIPIEPYLERTVDKALLYEMASQARSCVQKLYDAV